MAWSITHFWPGILTDFYINTLFFLTLAFWYLPKANTNVVKHLIYRFSKCKESLLVFKRPSKKMITNISTSTPSIAVHDSASVQTSQWGTPFGALCWPQYHLDSQMDCNRLLSRGTRPQDPWRRPDCKCILHAAIVCSICLQTANHIFICVTNSEGDYIFHYYHMDLYLY